APIVAIAVGVHAIVWTIAVPKYHGYGREGAARLAAFKHTQPGAIATIKPYSDIPTDFWFVGEDLEIARERQLVAIDAFGLRDIVFEPVFRSLDPNPDIQLALEVDGVTEAELRAAKPPAIWATELAAGRKQFD